MGQGSSIVTTVALVTAVALVQAQAWEFPHAMGVAKRKGEGGRSQVPPPLFFFFWSFKAIPAAYGGSWARR